MLLRRLSKRSAGSCLKNYNHSQADTKEPSKVEYKKSWCGNLSTSNSKDFDIKRKEMYRNIQGVGKKLKIFEGVSFEKRSNNHILGNACELSINWYRLFIVDSYSSHTDGELIYVMPLIKIDKTIRTIKNIR